MSVIDSKTKIVITFHLVCLAISITLSAFDKSTWFIVIIQWSMILYQIYSDMCYKRTMHEVSLDLHFWFENEKEIDEWMKDNIKMSAFACKRMGNDYYFLRKSDAAGFKLRWV